jgi:S1-C subfamily serine protease
MRPLAKSSFDPFPLHIGIAMPHFSVRPAFALVVLLLFMLLQALPASAADELAPPRGLSATAEQIFGQAQTGLLQVRTLLKSAQNQSSIGSGFLVAANGFAITNYHVVSQYALEPELYQLEYVTANGTRGNLNLHAIDVINDLAVVRLETPPERDSHVFSFDPAAVEGRLVKGERLFSMGNPFDLGFTIVEGTYNGLVEKSYQARVHFTGALNPGMSGGPAVNRNNQIVGVNVARRISSELVSFLVPADAARRLLEKARADVVMDAAAVRRDIGAQLDLWQRDFFTTLRAQGFHEVELGPYRVAESNASWFNCWANTNRDDHDKPRAMVNQSTCDTRTRLFLANDMTAGELELSHFYMKSVDLNAMQFASRLTRSVRPHMSYGARKRFTPYRCHEDFLTTNDRHPARPELRAAWCARAYRDFPDLYDVTVVLVTQDHDHEALVSKLSLTGIHFDNAVAFTQDFLAALRVQRDLD